MTEPDTTMGRVEVGSSLTAIDAHEYIDEGSAGLAEYVQGRQVSFHQALAKYDPVEAHYDPAHGSYMVMAERRPGVIERQTVGFAELGYSSPSPFTAWTREEHVAKLRDKQGLTQYYRMKRQDGTVRGALRQLKGPILSARWVIQPRSQSTRDVNIAKFVHDNLFQGMSSTWAATLENILLMCEYGHMVMEKVWTNEDVPGRITLRKLAPRHPLDVREWVYDIHGGPAGVIMEPPDLAQSDTELSNLGIPIHISKLAIFSLEPEAGDLRGISVLRSAYKHWYYKDTFYKIDAIQKERHGIGVPVIKLPPGYSLEDKRLAEELGRNLRTNDKAHIVLPPGWEVLFAKLEGNPVDCMKSIEHHDMQIMLNILAPFMKSEGVAMEDAEMFLRATRYIASTVSDIMNKFVIKPLVDMNFARGGYPELKARRIGEDNEARVRSFTVRNYVGAGVIVPDEPLELYIRDELDLPAPDPDTARVVATPQGAPGEDPNEPPGDEPNKPSKPTPGRTGSPRQARASTQGVGRRTTGIDRSGESSPSSS